MSKAEYTDHNTRRRELQKVPVGIAEIDAVAAARPIIAPFDNDPREARCASQ